MKPSFIRALAAGACLTFAVAGLARAEDIDLFTSGPPNAANAPNILIVLDNSANWSANNQGWTDPNGTFRPASGTTIVQLGPGVRLFFCDKYDFGVGTNFGVTGLNSVQDTYRFEMRVRF